MEHLSIGEGIVIGIFTIVLGFFTLIMMLADSKDE